MGSNPTQATAVLLFFVALTLIAVGLAADVSMVALTAGLASVAASIGLFVKCKPWEQREE